MNHRTAPVILILLLACLTLVSIPAAAQQSCESLKSIKIPNVTITSVTAGTPGFELPAQVRCYGQHTCHERSRFLFAESKPIRRRRATLISASKCGFPPQPTGMGNFWLQAIPGL